MSDGCGACGPPEQSMVKDLSYIRVLWVVVGMNSAMVLVGAAIAVWSGSVAVSADVLDFLSDALVTGLGLLLVGATARTRSRVSLWQGFVLAMLGGFVLVAAFGRAFGASAPEPVSMGIYGVLGLIVNFGAVLLLVRHRKGDSSVRAVWLFSRNDAIGNIVVLIAAFVVSATASHWPDVVAGVIIAALFLHSAIEIMRAARAELKQPVPPPVVLQATPNADAMR